MGLKSWKVRYNMLFENEVLIDELTYAASTTLSLKKNVGPKDVAVNDYSHLVEICTFQVTPKADYIQELMKLAIVGEPLNVRGYDISCDVRIKRGPDDALDHRWLTVVAKLNGVVLARATLHSSDNKLMDEWDETYARIKRQFERDEEEARLVAEYEQYVDAASYDEHAHYLLMYTAAANWDTNATWPIALDESEEV